MIDQALMQSIPDIETDNMKLMEFAFQWLKFSLFGEKTLKIKQHIGN